MLLDKLETKKEIICELKKEMDLVCKFFIVVNIEENITPAIYLDNMVIGFVDFIGAEFDLDLYIF
ncbi:protein of unknown function [Desulforamulus aeronauticus DSM 10349]|uniref:Uncharacterized protein n=1 Tax=Desulforamulus aeronauticus DSM 10349 TaxID=1121421 RepID=A0A1M6XDQ0_9FIRM|nr:DUF4279 domain-containing protein [Desulforamulus aeronauticus]SHL04076.1 protein of unknown function [Desulforamulus aeronauticus DSM 10349]